MAPSVHDEDSHGDVNVAFGVRADHLAVFQPCKIRDTLGWVDDIAAPGLRDSRLSVVCLVKHRAGLCRVPVVNVHLKVDVAVCPLDEVEKGNPASATCTVEKARTEHDGMYVLAVLHIIPRVRNGPWGVGSAAARLVRKPVVVAEEPGIRVGWMLKPASEMDQVFSSNVFLSHMSASS